MSSNPLQTGHKFSNMFGLDRDSEFHNFLFVSEKLVRSRRLSLAIDGRHGRTSQHMRQQTSSHTDELHIPMTSALPLFKAILPEGVGV